MTPAERKRIEKDAHEYAQKIASELDENAGKTLLKIYAIADYTAGATSEHDKARNQAIDDCMERIQKYFDKGDMDTPKLLTDILESLKTIS